MDDQTLTPPDKAEVRRRLDAARAALEAEIGRRSEAELVGRPADDAWSVKDHLAHLAAWEAGIAALLRRESRPAAMGVSDEMFAQGDEDATNEAIFAAHRDAPLADVLAASRRAHEALVAAVQALAEEELQKPYAYFLDGGEGEPGARPIWAYISGNSFGHTEEHLPWIRSVLEGLGSGD